MRRDVAQFLSVQKGPVKRERVRAILPRGAAKPGGKHTNMTLQFQKAIVEFEREGWVKRNGDMIEVLDAQALAAFALAAQKAHALYVSGKR